MLETLQGIHIEPTNICTLKCLRCPRTEFIEKFSNHWQNKNINLQELKNFLDIDLKNKTILLNGNYGDPIYYPDLIPMLEYFKSLGCKIILHTNASYVKDDTWYKLADIFDEHDIINFSIDGNPTNFTQYRVNGDWSSIERGIKIMACSRVHTVWKYIVFSYNIDNISSVKQLSEQLGIKQFVINNSDRWNGPDDWLDPKKYIPITENSKTGILTSGGYDGKKRIHGNINSKDSSTEINAVCKETNFMHFVSAEGFYLPCCWVGDHRFYYSSIFYKEKQRFNISSTTLSQVLFDLENFFQTIETKKPKYCKFNCAKL
jgi:sulfatase maturation enzyme AslB (radical SAM superfamily)